MKMPALSPVLYCILASISGFLTSKPPVVPLKLNHKTFRNPVISFYCSKLQIQISHFAKAFATFVCIAHQVVHEQSLGSLLSWVWSIGYNRSETFCSVSSCCRGDIKQETIPPWACGHVMCEAQHSPGFSLCENDMLVSRWMGAIRMLQEQVSAPERSWSKRLLFPRRRLVDSRWHKHRLMNIWSHPGLHLTQLAQTQRAAAQQFWTVCENICLRLAPTTLFFSWLKEDAVRESGGNRKMSYLFIDAVCTIFRLYKGIKLIRHNVVC